jgi:cation diffusion facilitator family transporter
MPTKEKAKDDVEGSPSINRVAAYSLLVNMALVAIKLVLAVASGSLALRADAVHSLVDVFDSSALILGLYISERKSKSFPYGLYKVENLVSVVISLMLFLTAYEIAREAVVGETHPVYGDWILFVVAALVPVPFLFGLYEVRAGEAANSPSLIADGRQFKVDALTETIVLFALIGQLFGLPLDRVAALIIAVFVVKEGWDILKNGMRVLLDASVDAPTLKKIREAIEAEPTVSSVKEVIARNSGRYLFVEAKVVLRVTDLKRAHQASERMEKDIREKVPHVVRVLIHYEPQSKTQVRYAIPLADTKGAISDHFGEAAYFALVDIDIQQKAVARQEVLANPYLDLTKGRGLKVAGFLRSYKPDAVVTRESLSGKGPGYVFAEAGVETLQTEALSQVDLVDRLLADLQI